jgi:hypothetical protein
LGGCKDDSKAGKSFIADLTARVKGRAPNNEGVRDQPRKEIVMMKKTLPLFSIALLTIGLQAQAPSSQITSLPQTQSSPQTPSSAQPPSAGMSQTESQTQEAPKRTTAVTAELTKKIDTKNAKVGDAVEAKVLTPSKLPDGTELQKGSKLVGKVTDVKARGKEDKNSHLAFSLDRAQTKDGQEIQVQTTVVSVTAPSNTASAGLTPAPTTGGTGSSATTGAGSSQGESTMGGMLKNSKDRVPVGNMPGVMLAGSNDASTAGTLHAQDQNIELASGTTLILNVSN